MDDWYSGMSTTWLSLLRPLLNLDQFSQHKWRAGGCKWSWLRENVTVPNSWREAMRASYCECMKVCETTLVMWVCVACRPRMLLSELAGLVGRFRGAWVTIDEMRDTHTHTHTHTHTAPPSSPFPNSWEHTLAPQRPSSWLSTSNATWHLLMHPCFHTSCKHGNTSTHIYVHGLAKAGMPAVRLCHRWTAHPPLRCNKAVLVWKETTGVFWGESGLLP